MVFDYITWRFAPRSPVVAPLGLDGWTSAGFRNGKRVLLEPREVAEQEVQIQFTHSDQTQAARRPRRKLAGGISRMRAITMYPLITRRPHGGQGLASSRREERSTKCGYQVPKMSNESRAWDIMVDLNRGARQAIGRSRSRGR